MMKFATYSTDGFPSSLVGFDNVTTTLAILRIWHGARGNLELLP